MVDSRARQYGECAALLEADFEAEGGAALFDQAVSNGLAAIVACEWPGQELGPKGKVKSASELLKVIRRECQQEVRPGVLRMPQPPSRPAQGFYPMMPIVELEEINVAALQKGIETTQPIRHARRGAGVSLERVHVESLCALNSHRALESMRDVRLDRVWRDAKVKDLWSQMHAVDYLALIGEDEAQRRAETADSYSSWRPDDPSPWDSIQECPVCGYNSLVANSFDSNGNGVGIGMCLVCSYERSSMIADEESFDIEWETRLKYD